MSGSVNRDWNLWNCSMYVFYFVYIEIVAWRRVAKWIAYSADVYKVICNVENNLNLIDRKDDYTICIDTCIALSRHLTLLYILKKGLDMY